MLLRLMFISLLCGVLYAQDSPRNRHCVVSLAVVMPKAEKPDRMAHLTILFRPRFASKPACRFEKDANGNPPTAQWMLVTADQAVIASIPSELVSFYCSEAP